MYILVERLGTTGDSLDYQLHNRSSAFGKTTNVILYFNTCNFYNCVFWFDFLTPSMLYFVRLSWMDPHLRAYSLVCYDPESHLPEQCGCSHLVQKIYTRNFCSCFLIFFQILYVFTLLFLSPFKSVKFNSPPISEQNTLHLLNVTCFIFVTSTIHNVKALCESNAL